MENKNIDSLYILKALAMIFVLLVHFELCGRRYLEPIYKTGVPIFFIISGYLLYSSSIADFKKKIIRSLKKILLLCFFFQLIYLIFNIFIYNRKYDFLDYSFWLRLIIYGDNISGHLWFLNSYVWSLLFFLFCLQLRALSTYFNVLISILFLIILLLAGQYKFLLGFNHSYIYYYIPSVFLSIPMFIAGFLCKKYESYLNAILRGKIIYILLISIILCYCEHRILSTLGLYSGTYMITTCLTTIVLLITTLIYKEELQGKYISLVNLGKYHSANIYYWQFIPSVLVCKLLEDSFLNNFTFIFVGIILLLWSYFLQKTSFLVNKLFHTI